MTPALYQRFRPVAAFRAMLHRRQSRADLRAELDAAIEERDEARKEYRRQIEWNVCQSQNIGEGLRQVEALRAATAQMLRASALRRDVCNCAALQTRLTSVCAAWRSLGFEGHFDADKAADLLPLVKP